MITVRLDLFRKRRPEVPVRRPQVLRFVAGDAFDHGRGPLDVIENPDVTVALLDQLEVAVVGGVIFGLVAAPVLLWAAPRQTPPSTLRHRSSAFFERRH